MPQYSDIPQGFDVADAQSHSDIPDGFRVVQNSAASNPSEYDPTSQAFQAKYGATSSMGAGQRALAGAGKAFVDLGRGAAQLVGQYSRQDVAQSRALDAPLMQSGWAAKLGNIGGNIAATIPALAIPGAASIPGAAAIGGGLGLLQPSTSTKETVLNTGIGAAAGAAGQYIGNKISGAVSSRLGDRAAAAADEASLNSARDAVLARSREAGLVVPPTAVNPNITNTALESVAGKAAIRHSAEATNAPIINGLIKEDLGIAANQPVTKSVLQSIRAQAGQAAKVVRGAGAIAADQTYLDEIAKIASTGADLEGAFPGIGAQANEKVKELATSLAQPQFDASSAVSAYNFLLNKAKQSFQAAFVPGGNPQALELARAQRGAADAMGDLIQRHLDSTGNQALGEAWQAARKTIAQSHTAEAALKGGNINAINLAAQLRKGAPLTGGFKTVAEFADMFPEAARIPKSGVAVSKLGALVTAGKLVGAGAAIAHGNLPLGVGLGVSVAAPGAIRSGILSSAGQSLLATPNYAPNMLGTLGLNAIGGAAKYGTLPTYLAVNQLAQADEQNPPQPR